MRKFKQMSLKEKIELLGIIILYPFIMLFAKLGKECKLFCQKNRRTTASILSIFMLVTAISVMSVTVLANSGTVHSVTLNGGDYGTLKKDGSSVNGNTATFNVTDGDTLDNYGYTIEANQGYSLKGLEVKTNGKVIDVQSGGFHTVVLLSDGTVWAVGYNDYGQLGDGTYYKKSKFVQMLDSNTDQPMKDVKAISAGGNHTVVLKNDGTVWAVGRNDSGQLSDGTSGLGNTKEKFVQMLDNTGSMQNVKAISAGGEHTVVLKNDGTVWAVGSNYRNQLGDGTSGIKTDKSKFVQMLDNTGSMQDVKAISAGAVHTVALKNDGTVWAVGNNDDGQLGDGTSGSTKSKFVQMHDNTGSMQNVKAISAWYYNTVALKNDGTVWAVGQNAFGQLGNGTQDYKSIFIQTYDNTEAMKDVKAISAGGGHIVAIKNDGTVWAVGNNDNGQLGDGTSGNGTDKSKFVQMLDNTGSMQDVKAISAGSVHTVALKNDGTVLTVGNNKYGQLGDGTNTDASKFIASDISMFNSTTTKSSLADIVVTRGITVTAKTIKSTTLSLLANIESINYGENITLTATISDVDNISGKTVKFYNGTTELASVKTNSNGVATYTVTSPKIGDYNYTAKFEADGTNLDATSNTVNVKVVKAPLNGSVEKLKNSMDKYSEKTLKTSDEESLKEIMKQSDELLKTGNLSDEEKDILKEIKEKANNLITIINKVKTVQDLISKIPETVSKNDKDIVNAAQNEYNKLTDLEKQMLDQSLFNKLKNAVSIINKPDNPDKPDSESPTTGDTNNMKLWLALLFVSGGIVLELDISKKLKKANSK